METHRLDPTALVSGLLFTLSGLTVIADQTWESIDVTAFVGAGVCLLGAILAITILVRFLRDGSRTPELDTEVYGNPPTET